MTRRSYRRKRGVRRRRAQRKDGYFYVFWMPVPFGIDHYKLGESFNDVDGRLKSVQTGASRKVYEHSRYYVSNRRKVEGMMHARFEHKRIQKGSRNEWFRLNIADLLEIQLRLIGRQK